MQEGLPKARCHEIGEKWIVEYFLQPLSQMEILQDYNDGATGHKPSRCNNFTSYSALSLEPEAIYVSWFPIVHANARIGLIC
jgi:hypothetical protein